MIRYIRWFIISILLFSWAFFLELLLLLLLSGLVALQTGNSSVLPLFSVGYSGSWIPMSISSLVTSIQFLQLPSGWPWASECSGGMRWADTLWVSPDSGMWGNPLSRSQHVWMSLPRGSQPRSDNAGTFLALSFFTSEVRAMPWMLCLINFLCEGQWDNVCGHTL